MAKFNNITIIGVGLIGGSIGLAAKKRRVAKEVTGVFRRKSTLKKALKFKAVDKAVMDIKEGVKDADLIVLAAPVYSIPKLASEAIRHAKKGALITDVGSTKVWIVKKLEGMVRSSGRIRFVGSHPMAGSEHAGVEFARADLLEGSPCIVTKTLKTDGPALKRIIGFWKALGSRVSVMTPERHDRAVAMISHLPHIVAFSLAGAAAPEDIVHAAEGFKDTTRIASSDPELWADIFLTNRRQIASAAADFKRYSEGLLRAVSKGDYKGTVRMLKKAKAKRDRCI